MLTLMILVLIIGKSVPYMWPYRPSYASVVSSSRDPAAVDREMPMPNNVADDDLESDSGFIGNYRRMFGFEREYYHPNNIMPERPWSAVFAVNQTSENSAKDIFEDLQNIGIPARGVRCLQRVSNDRFCITTENTAHRWLSWLSIGLS